MKMQNGYDNGETASHRIKSLFLSGHMVQVLGTGIFLVRSFMKFCPWKETKQKKRKSYAWSRLDLHLLETVLPEGSKGSNTIFTEVDKNVPIKC